MTEAELAYCAGVIDSDGTIGIKRSTYKMRRVGDCRQPTYSERVCVKQVEPHAVELLHRLFAGSLYMTDPSAKRGRALHSWQVTDLKAAACLRAILPYLRIKREQAENCLALRDVKEESKRARVAPGRGHEGSAPRPAHLSERMEALCLRGHELNRVGVAAYGDVTTACTFSTVPASRRESPTRTRSRSSLTAPTPRSAPAC